MFLISRIVAIIMKSTSATPERSRRRSVKPSFGTRSESGETMGSSKAYLDFILEQLSELDEISARAMMGEYIIYYRGKIIGGIYDDRFLVKPTKSAAAMMPNAPMEQPYEGAKAMLLVDDVENRAFLRELLDAVASEVPTPKKRNQKVKFGKGK